MSNFSGGGVGATPRAPHSERGGKVPPRKAPLRATVGALTTSAATTAIPGLSNHATSTSLLSKPSNIRPLIGTLTICQENDVVSNEDAGRDAYVTLVKEVTTERASFNSPNLFCESLLRKADRINDRMFAADPVKRRCIKTAAASWVLAFLAEHSTTPVLQEVRDALFPSIFLEYTSAGVLATSTSVQIELQQSSIAMNPYLSHDLFFERHEERNTELLDVKRTRDNLGLLVMQKSKSSKMVIRIWQRKVVSRVMHAWRKFVRTQRINHFQNEMQERHGNRETRRVTLDLMFTRWKLSLATSSYVFSQEKLNGLIYQLDNAKNQFQLQCFRSDKYLRTVEELREELSATRSERDDYRNESRERVRELKTFEDVAKVKLNEHINMLVHVLGNWRSFARLRVEEKLQVSRNSDILDEGFDAALREKAQQHHLQDQQQREGEEQDEEEEEEEEEMSLDGSDVDEEEEGGNADGDDKAKSQDKPKKHKDISPEKVLLRWINSVNAASVVSQIKKVHNFTSDFQSGEVLLVLMHHVFPNKIPFSPLQENNIPKRLELIVQLGREVGCAHIPKVNDIMEGTGDLMIMVSTELFMRHLSRQRVEGRELNKPATAAAGAAAEAESARTTAENTKYDVDMLDAVYKDAEKEMLRLMDQENMALVQEQRLLELEETLTQHAAYLSRERLNGNPVQILDGREVARYCRLNTTRFRDIAFKYKKAPQEILADIWLDFDHQLIELKKKLKKHFHTMRRIFVYYAGSPKVGATMLDTDYWRFVGDIRVMDRTCTRHTIDRIFVTANADDVPEVDENGNEIKNEDEDPDEEVEEEENPATELIPSEFVECLIRMADAKISNKMLHDRFETFMHNYVQPFACKSEMDRFRKEIYTASTQNALERFHKDLIKLFQHHGKGKGKAKVIYINEFVDMLSNGSIMTGGLDEAAVASTVQNICQDKDSEHPSLAQHEFMEAIVSICQFKIPSPFISLDKKVDVVVSQLISSLRPRMKGVVQLADVKPVQLSQR